MLVLWFTPTASSFEDKPDRGEQKSHWNFSCKIYSLPLHFISLSGSVCYPMAFFTKLVVISFFIYFFNAWPSFSENETKMLIAAKRFRRVSPSPFRRWLYSCSFVLGSEGLVLPALKKAVAFPTHGCPFVYNKGTPLPHHFKKVVIVSNWNIIIPESNSK